MRCVLRREHALVVLATAGSRMHFQRIPARSVVVLERSRGKLLVVGKKTEAGKQLSLDAG